MFELLKTGEIVQNDQHVGRACIGRERQGAGVEFSGVAAIMQDGEVIRGESNRAREDLADEMLQGRREVGKRSLGRFAGWQAKQTFSLGSAG